MLLPTILMVKKQLLAVQNQSLKCCTPVINCFLRSVETRFEKILDCRTPEGEKAALAALTLPMFKDAWVVCIDPDQKTHLQGRFEEVLSSHERALEKPLVSALPVVDNYYNFSDESGSSLSRLAVSHVTSAT